MNEPEKRLLVIDDEAEIMRFIGEVGRGQGFEVRLADDADHFRRAIQEFDPSYIVMDLQMPDADGIQLIRYLADEECQAAILLISGLDDRVLKSAEKLGRSLGLRMAGRLTKPVMLDDLEMMLTAVPGGEMRFTKELILNAIDDGQMVVHYQPKARLRLTGPIYMCGAEAFVRWKHPVQGLMMPGSFLAKAEELGLSGELSRCVLEQVLAANAAWAEKGEEVNVGVNVSARQLVEDDFPDMVEELLARYDVPADRLMLELSETSAMTDAEQSLAILKRLRKKGVELCLDNFGTASSPLIMLYRMPFSEVKVDTSFILEVRRSEEARSVVAAVVNLAHALGLNVCAEGVESEPTLNFLRSVGCDIAQGYYVCKPLPQDRAYRFLARWSKHVEEQEKKIREQWSMAG